MNDTPTIPMPSDQVTPAQMPEPVSPATKPGYKTTEFYLSTAAAVLGAVMASGLVPSAGPWAQLVGIAAVVLSSMGYTVSRGMAKSGN